MRDGERKIEREREGGGKGARPRVSRKHFSVYMVFIFCSISNPIIAVTTERLDGISNFLYQNDRIASENLRSKFGVCSYHSMRSGSDFRSESL